jgi:hypothetical protein
MLFIVLLFDLLSQKKGVDYSCCSLSAVKALDCLWFDKLRIIHAQGVNFPRAYSHSHRIVEILTAGIIGG